MSARSVEYSYIESIYQTSAGNASLSQGNFHRHMVFPARTLCGNNTCLISNYLRIARKWVVITTMYLCVFLVPKDSPQAHYLLIPLAPLLVLTELFSPSLQPRILSDGQQQCTSTNVTRFWRFGPALIQVCRDLATMHSSASRWSTI